LFPNIKLIHPFEEAIISLHAVSSPFFYMEVKFGPLEKRIK